MKKRIVEIDNEIELLNQEKEGIQLRCKHKKVNKKHYGDTGNFDPNDNCYWTRFHCPDCDKVWMEEGTK